MLVYLLTFASE